MFESQCIISNVKPAPGPAAVHGEAVISIRLLKGGSLLSARCWPGNVDPVVLVIFPGSPDPCCHTHACARTHTRTYTHAYIHTYTHTYINEIEQTCSLNTFITLHFSPVYRTILMLLPERFCSNVAGTLCEWSRLSGWAWGWGRAQPLAKPFRPRNKWCVGTTGEKRTHSSGVWRNRVWPPGAFDLLTTFRQIYQL